MSPKLPRLRSKELVRLLESRGFVRDHQTGSHAVFRHADGRRVTVPMHTGRTVGVGLLRRILADAGIDSDQLR
jgi:predicted RNA binding protein YcfA (HicA-like mRNA interferase family)